MAAFGEGKNGHKIFRQTRIYYFRDKCVVLRVIPKGWLAIAKLKRLSLVISLFYHCQMLSFKTFTLHFSIINA